MNFGGLPIRRALVGYSGAASDVGPETSSGLIFFRCLRHCRLYLRFWLTRWHGRVGSGRYRDLVYRVSSLLAAADVVRTQRPA